MPVAVTHFTHNGNVDASPHLSATSAITRAEIVILLLKARNGGSYSPPASFHNLQQ
ncbi:MAG: hypothetical protein HY864_09025 [Chloroflexi bacterium]|nr:hypothetical protein [Chloroflexota bacterium]